MVPRPPSRPPPLPVRSEASFGVPTERKDAELAPGVTGVHRTWGGLWRAGALCRTGWTGPGALPVPSLRDPSQVVPVSRLRSSLVSAGVDGALDAGWPMLGAQQTLGSLFLLSRYALLPA